MSIAAKRATLPRMNNDNAETHHIRACPVCDRIPDSIKTSRPLGRTADIYRVECLCGNGALSMWSPTATAAVRLWNRHNANNVEDKPKK